MPLIIDGYNVMHIVGILGSGVGPGGLQRARLALLNFLAESLEPGEAARTTVVFDAAAPPPGRPRALKHRGIAVRFASAYASADAQIESLIRRDSAPRKLTVVSSDHGIQRAARRRRARAVDADVWYAEIVRRRRERERCVPESSARPPVPLLAEDVDYWIRQFGGESFLGELAELDEPSSSGETERHPEVEDPFDPLNPFPPGYGEDVEE
jgi:predicted RNA-binding protein with PIN domain